MLESHISYETPEGIQVKLQVAGPLVRSIAWFIDLLIRGVIYAAAGSILVYLGKVGEGILLIGFFLMEWMYPTVFEAIKGGTPGKLLMNLNVVMDDGTALTWQASLIRNLLRTVDFLPFLYVIGFIFSITHSDFKRIGDLVAGSIVIYQEKRESNSNQEESLANPAKSLPLSFTAQEQRTILQFIDDKNRLTVNRQRELANILSPILHCENDDALNALQQHAAWIKGGSQ